MKHREHWNRWDTCHCHYPSVTEMALCMPHATALCRYSMFFFLYCNFYSRITVSPRTPNCIELPRSHDVPSKRECGSTFYFQAAVLQPNALDVPSMIALVANSIVSFDLAHVVFGKWKNRVECRRNSTIVSLVQYGQGIIVPKGWQRTGLKSKWDMRTWSEHEVATASGCFAGSYQVLQASVGSSSWGLWMYLEWLSCPQLHATPCILYSFVNVCTRRYMIYYIILYIIILHICIHILHAYQLHYTSSIC